MSANGLPRVGQLPLGKRFQSAYEDEARAYRAELRKGLESGGRTLTVAQKNTGIDSSHMSRMLDGSANPDPELVIEALFRDETYGFIRYLCELAGGEFTPKPLPGWEVFGPALRAELAKRDLWDTFAKLIKFPPRPDGFMPTKPEEKP